MTTDTERAKLLQQEVETLEAPVRDALVCARDVFLFLLACALGIALFLLYAILVIIAREYFHGIRGCVLPASTAPDPAICRKAFSHTSKDDFYVWSVLIAVFYIPACIVALLVLIFEGPAACRTIWRGMLLIVEKIRNSGGSPYAERLEQEMNESFRQAQHLLVIIGGVIFVPLFFLWLLVSMRAACWMLYPTECYAEFGALTADFPPCVKDTLRFTLPSFLVLTATFFLSPLLLVAGLMALTHLRRLFWARVQLFWHLSVQRELV